MRTPRKTAKIAPRRARGVSSPAASDVGAKQKDLLEESLAYAIRRAQVRCDEVLLRYLDPGVSPARLAALSTVGANPGISQRELSELLSIAAPSVVKVLDDLEKMSLLRRDKINGRLHALKLTKKGVEDLQRYRLSVNVFEAEIAVRLTAAQRAQLLSLLRDVAR
ncbi:MarR family winged helix-turn-helix transcriptional regulator [Tardiphaga sp. 709]|uniref:MarR family winged helix-turn-helix transcriptional regulator n=1 Tax=Tardiphaga sp. 709 TaxID=3076039 RepID=UPI0028E4DEBE|nr:MarR family transcriptional regulator [Tardiphaga sp. 709]WNV11748.1 MarR family transcriptional regulator [Tardiphaga sp. 709]